MVVSIFDTGILAGFEGCEAERSHSHPLRTAHFNSYFRENVIA
ncbi:MAG: hypothetical protein V7L22_05385 [Nostoc sp.]